MLTRVQERCVAVAVEILTESRAAWVTQGNEMYMIVGFDFDEEYMDPSDFPDDTIIVLRAEFC
jgi:hypothetical protein